MLPSDHACDTTFIGPILPFDTPPNPEAYFGLLTNPPGTYGQMKYGATTAYTLHGSPEFRTKAENLFGSFGGESIRECTNGSYSYTTRLVVRPGYDPNAYFFCCPQHRFKTALRLYFYGQLYKEKAITEDVLDSDGDFVDSILLNDEALMHEAARWAESFLLYCVPADYSVMPESSDRDLTPAEHSVSSLVYQPSDDFN